MTFHVEQALVPRELRSSEVVSMALELTQKSEKPFLALHFTVPELPRYLVACRRLGSEAIDASVK
jgi:hypothetical protein